MKKILVLFSFIALIVMTDCKKDKATDENDTAKTMINEIFNASMTSYSKAMGAKSRFQINVSIDDMQASPKGGYLHIIGSLTGNININEQTGDCLGGILLFGVSVCPVNDVMEINGKDYTWNGDPYISITATFTLAPGCSTFATASSIQVGGAFHLTGPDYDQTTNMMITINLNSSGTGGDVSGTYGGESVYYTF
jgi:hypothetical protein